MPILQSTNLSATSLVVPDVYVEITPPSALTLNGVPSNLAAFVGTASWGPSNTVVNGSQFSDFLLNFGQLNNRKFDMGTHVAVGIQQGMNNFSCVRVTDGTDAAASAVLGSTQLTYTALHTGTLGNSISVTIGNGSKANSYRFVVYVPGYTPETFDNIAAVPTTTTAVTSGAVTAATSVTLASANTNIVVGMTVAGTGVTGSPTVSTVTDSTHIVLSSSQTISSGTTLTFTATNNSLWVAAAAAINGGQNAARPASRWVTAVAGSATTAPTLATTTLSGGTDGVTTITSAVLVGSDPGVGMHAHSGSGFALLDLCDADDPTSWTAIDSFAVAESAYAIQTAAAGTSVSATVTAKQTAGLDSYNSKIFLGDWLYWIDPVLQVTRLVSPQAFAIGRLANLAPQLSGLNKTLYGIAGSQKSGLVGGSNVTAPYAQADLNTLEINGIDVICNPAAGGIRIWAMRFGHNSSSNPTIHGDNYTTLTNYIAKTLNGGLGFYLGRPISAQLFLDTTATLSQFAQTLQGAGVIGKSDGTIPYAIVCNASNNPPSSIKQGILNASVQMSYLGLVEKFIVNLQNGTEISISSSLISNTQ